jgi:phenylalanyl-tRNA synthetase beta chain
MGLADPVIEIAITPNRGDCLGVRGIARDLAAAGLGRLKPLDTSPVAGAFESPIGVTLDVRRRAADACPYVRRPLLPRRPQRPEPRVAAATGCSPSGSGRSRRWSTSPTT